jgi:hypothetical protein
MMPPVKSRTHNFAAFSHTHWEPHGTQPPPAGVFLDAAPRAGYNQGMTAKPKRRTRQTRTKPPDAVQEAIDYGIDIAALRENLARTPAERLRRHQIALDRVRMLQKARFL